MTKVYNDERVTGAVSLDGFGNDPTVGVWQYASASGGIVNTVTAVTLKAAVAGKSNYLSTIQICHSVLGGQTEYVILDGATIIYLGNLQTAANESGSSMSFWPCLKSTAGNALKFQLSSAVTGAVYVNAQGYSGS